MQESSDGVIHSKRSDGKSSVGTTDATVNCYYERSAGRSSVITRALLGYLAERAPVGAGEHILPPPPA